MALNGASGETDYQSVAAELSDLFAMSVKLEQAGAEIRSLELRLRFLPDTSLSTSRWHSEPTLTTKRRSCQRYSLAGPADPRTPAVLPGLLTGLAAIPRAMGAGCGGFTAATRRAAGSSKLSTGKEGSGL